MTGADGPRYKGCQHKEEQCHDPRTTVGLDEEAWRADPDSPWTTAPLAR